MFPVLSTVIVYSITSPGLTFVVSVVVSVIVLPFTAVAVLSTFIPGVGSTGVSSSSSSSTSSGVVGFSGSTGVSPVTTTLLYITCSGFPWMSFSCVTVYVAVIVSDSPAAKSPICKSSGATSIPSSCSSTTTFVKSTLPIFVTTMLYSITSPA